MKINAILKSKTDLIKEKEKIKIFANHDVKQKMVIKRINLISLDLTKSNKNKKDNKEEEEKDKHDVPKSKKKQKHKDNR